MAVPLYLLERIARHGPAAQRLLRELEAHEGGTDALSTRHAISFDVADLVWVLLCLRGDEEAQESREVRNSVAEALMPVLEQWIKG